MGRRRKEGYEEDEGEEEDEAEDDEGQGPPKHLAGADKRGWSRRG